MFILNLIRGQSELKSDRLITWGSRFAGNQTGQDQAPKRHNHVLVTHKSNQNREPLKRTTKRRFNIQTNNKRNKTRCGGGLTNESSAIITIEATIN